MKNTSKGEKKNGQGAIFKNNLKMELTQPSLEYFQSKTTFTRGGLVRNKGDMTRKPKQLEHRARNQLP